ncbi:tetratricopeptide repeat protein [Microbulbifer sp. 2205BS26-8]|uniref:YfgM family protein n=1 Tax=Microbulbifer sp. 2205BS26-8 TaxID=3064386 RepID=UPI00273DD2D8|nr:tetratricopeptide repeat protein [Microbulbifer sp. 2205BS26-8]MDP5210068.1 tetratricopeptide repeat protein [Microbulbifer sp. 2205BS26-8]
MAEHLTEQEQIETLKRWWAENGRGIVTGVALALAGYFGYQWWQGDQRAKAEAASDLYQSFVEAVSANNNQPDNKQLTTAKTLADQLRNDFASRIYASQASLRLAAIAADSNDLEAAQQQLQWVLDNTDETALQLLAKRRLAAVVAARGNPDEALKLVAGTVPPAFAALYAETRGDILKQQGDDVGARAAYEQALAELLPEQAGSAQLLRLKADSLAAASGDGVPQEASSEPTSGGED